MLKYRLASLIEVHPFVWKSAWSAVHHLKFLLPHDKSYFAIRHFGGDQQSLLLDIGGNDGISALSFRKLNKNIQILSLEPNTVHRDALSALKRRDPLFDFKLVGAGESSGILNLYSPRYRGVNLHTFASSDPDQVREAVAKSFGESVSKALEVEEVSAPIVTVDELDVAPRIIKVDVEGFDYQVLCGAERTITVHRPYLIVEACHVDIGPFRAFFQRLDYQMVNYIVAKARFVPLNDADIVYETGARNIFAVPRETLSSLPFGTNS
ncbi:unnamed protein product [Ectocarpus sp. 12 AP-2014]